MSNDNIDYDKQFEADLEKAQALSLETLALEKYRMQKLYQQQSNVSRKSPDISKPPVADPGKTNITKKKNGQGFLIWLFDR